MTNDKNKQTFSSFFPSNPLSFFYEPEQEYFYFKGGQAFIGVFDFFLIFKDPDIYPRFNRDQKHYYNESYS